MPYSVKRLERVTTFGMVLQRDQWRVYFILLFFNCILLVLLDMYKNNFVEDIFSNVIKS